jgi:adenylosuccinate lyase
MAALWIDEAKFGQWVQSLLAVLHGRVLAGQIDEDTFQQINSAVGVDVERVQELDRQFSHDASALIETARESLRKAKIDETTTVKLGAKVTSYDMEDPAFSIIICKALDLILKANKDLVAVLILRADEFKTTPCIFLTHGQPAVPGYLGLRFCRWIAMLLRDQKRIKSVQRQMRVGKFSGAGGIYDELDPGLEKSACDWLGLETDEASSQIIHRDRHAWVMTTLAVAASNVSQIANDLWLMCAYPRSEAREYTDPNQRGSTAMPHKKNPINLEKIRGLSSPVRAYALVASEHVMTYDERAIDQSSSERIIWPDATILLHYMLVSMAEIVSKMLFFPTKMKANLDKLQGIWAAQYVKNLLWDKGIYELEFGGLTGEKEMLPTYRWVQACAFEAWNQATNEPLTPFLLVLRKHRIHLYLTEEELNRCFDLRHVLRNAGAIYARFGI